MSTSDSCTPGRRCPSSSPSTSTYSESPSVVTTIIISPSTFNTGSFIPALATSQSGSAHTIVTQPTSPTSTSLAFATPTPTPTPTSLSLSSSPTSSATPVVDAVTSSPNVGAIAGGVIGVIIFLVCLALGILLYLRARKRKRTAPSSEFMNSLRAGDPPVLRLDSGAKYTPALPEKGSYSHYSSSTPLPLMQNSYYTSPVMENMKFPDGMMMSDIPSSRPSVEKPLHPQRFSDQGHHTSIGSDFRSRRQSLGRGGEALEFAPRYSMDDPPSRPFSATPQDSVFHEVAGQQSPPRVLSPSLQPLRRQEGT